MLRPLLESEKVPLIPVTSKALGYFVSVAVPYVNWTLPLTPGPTKLKSNVLAFACQGSDTATSRIVKITSSFPIVPRIFLIFFPSFSLCGCIGLSKTRTCVLTRILLSICHFFSRKQASLVPIETRDDATVLEIGTSAGPVIEPWDYGCGIRSTVSTVLRRQDLGGGAAGSRTFGGLPPGNRRCVPYPAGRRGSR